jgi:hypothetical protein
MDKISLLFVSFLVILWWMALWGLLDIGFKQLVGNSTQKMVNLYILMIVFVLAIVFTYPKIIERFL